MSFDWPRGGMFIWVRVHFENHPLWQAAGGRSVALFDGPALSSALFVFFTHKPFKVVPSLGSVFAANPEIEANRAWAYWRLCFAAEAEENIDPASKQFVAAVQKFWRIKDVEEMEKLVDELNFAQVEAEDMEGMHNLGAVLGC
jgi:DNA-binding transcriptional MocR family regulator